MKQMPPNREDLLREYDFNQRSCDSIGKDYGVSGHCISTWLKRHGIPARAGRLFLFTLTKEELEDLYVNQRKTTADIGEMHHVEKGTVRNALKRYDIPRRDLSGYRAIRDDDRRVEEMYASGKTTIEIGTFYGVTSGTVGNTLKRRGIEVRNWLTHTSGNAVIERTENNRLSIAIGLTKKELDDLYHKHRMSMRQIADIFGTTHTRIEKEMRRLNIKPRNRRGSLFNISEDEIVRLYCDLRLTEREIANMHGISESVVRGGLRLYGIPRDKGRQARFFRNHRWRGDSCTYGGFHLRVRKLRGEADFCECCGETEHRVWYEWANLTGDYADIWDYVRLCRGCHKRLHAGTITTEEIVQRIGVKEQRRTQWLGLVPEALTLTDCYANFGGPALDKPTGAKGAIQ